MNPFTCLASFRHESDGLPSLDDQLHRCFQHTGHDGRHACICVTRGILSIYGPRYYGRDGKPIPMCEWSVRFEDREGYSRIAATTVGQWWISTVWLGMDHGFRLLREGEPVVPVIFETMVFWHGPEGGEPDQDRFQDRYCTEKEARRGHAAVVRRYRKEAKKLAQLDRIGGKC